jgi:predicted AlkP superfamily pyrophosphatase or phosphodiesterase
MISMHMRVLFLLVAFPSLFCAATEPPRLVLQITVDQLRGDMLPRYYNRFGPGGFRRLLDQGVYFANAHYTSANTFTASGHAVLSTGADTAEHGMVANEWYNRETGTTQYCTADSRYPILGDTGKSGAGMSPANLSSTTFGDELVLASARHSRAFAVAGKDRSAIIPGGHLGKAFWFLESTGGFTSSTYYFETLPSWAAAWNDQKHFAQYRTLEWKPLRDLASYKYAANASNGLSRPDKTLGNIFPHPLVAKSDAIFFAAFRCTPFLDELTASFTRELIAHEKIGQSESTDFLSISFSATDYIGHAFGPDSVEYEDNLLRLDATLAELLDFVDRTVGLGRTVIVLSADHGVDDIPEERRALGFDAQRIYPDKYRARANEALRARFNITEDIVAAFIPPGFYLDRGKIAALKLDAVMVENALAETVRQIPGVAYAFTRTALLAGEVTRTPMVEKVQRAFHPTRSGDVVITQAQFWYMYPNPEAYAAMHGSPYSYDTFVPIVWVSPGNEHAVVYDAVEPAQISTTLSALLGIRPPSGCRSNQLLPGIFTHHAR